MPERANGDMARGPEDGRANFVPGDLLDLQRD